jgi:hypothetical protein
LSQGIVLPPSSGTELKMKAAHCTYKITVSQLVSYLQYWEWDQGIVASLHLSSSCKTVRVLMFD